MSGLIDIDFSKFEKDFEIIQLAGRRAPMMMQAVIRFAGTRVQPPWRHALAKQSGIKGREIQRATKARNYASGSEFIYELKVSADWTYLSRFSPQASSDGVEAGPWNNRRIFTGTFLAGVDYEGGNHLGVFVRSTDDRFPIKQLFGPNVAIEAIRDDAAKTFEKESERALEASLQQQITQLFA